MRLFIAQRRRALERHPDQAVRLGNHHHPDRVGAAQLERRGHQAGELAAVSGAGTGQSIPEPFTSWDEFFSELVTDMISGAEAAPIKAFVLRRRSILPPLTNVSPGFDGAGEVYSTQSLLTAEPTIPVNFRDAMPPGWWAKKTPTATQNSDGTWAYVVEYWWAKEASRIIYDRNE